MLLKKNIFALLITGHLILIACAHTTGPAASAGAIPLEVIHRGNLFHGSDKTSGGVWIDRQEQFASIMGRLQKGQFSGSTEPLPEIDFNQYGVLLVWMGKKNTGGYALNLLTDQAEMNGGSARVTLDWIEPQKGKLLTQTITHPFIMVKIPKGAYDNIHIVDQNGFEKVVVDTDAK